MSAESTQQLATDFDIEEAICARLAAKRERAHTSIGRAILGYRLESHRQKLGHLTDEFDMIILHGDPSDAQSMR
jgi:hypothetical protein